jgi:hypothetical protein
VYADQQLLKVVPGGPIPGYWFCGATRQQDDQMRWMRLLATVAAIGAWLALPAQVTAQARRPHPEDKKEEKKPVIDENAYKAALERIPEPKEKYDPWSGARPTEPAKKSK